MSLQWRLRSSRLFYSCLLASYLISIIFYTPTKAAASLVTPQESLSLIVCAVDGSVYTIDALSGQARGYFGTNKPLLGSSMPSRIRPGLDGSIYTLSSEGKEVQTFPLTVQQVIEHPVQTCSGDVCGVVTGTKQTFMYGLDPSTGRLEWTQQFGKTYPEEEEGGENLSVVILHREDYVVRHISTSTGEELWNVTLGHVSALDFTAQWNSEDSPQLPPGDHKRPQREPSASSSMMPSIAFGSEGTTVTAINNNRQILWRRKLNTVIASVYGVVGNDFVPVAVVDTSKEQIEPSDDDDDGTALVPLVPPRRAKDVRSQQRDLYLNLLWNEARGMPAFAEGSSNMVVFHPPPKNYKQSAEFNRLAQKVTLCKGLIIDGVCYETPLLPSGEKEAVSQTGIHVTWDQLFVTLVILSLGIRILIAHNRRKWNAERQRSPPRKQVDDRFLSLSDHTVPPFASKSMMVLGLSRVTSLPDLHTRNITSPGEKSRLWNLERVELHRATTVPMATTVPTATDTSGSLSFEVDGIPFVKHSRYLSEFREIAPLGKGGFGSVFQCENLLDGCQYAIKKVRISSGQEFSVRLQRVLREIKSLAKLDHPNIVRYYTAWLEAEEDNGEREVDVAEASTSIGQCYSAELLTSNAPPPSSGMDGRRPPTSPSVGTKKIFSTYNDMANPLGWNGIDLDGSFDDKNESASQEGSDFGGFHFDRTSCSLDDGMNEESSDSSSSQDDSKQLSLARSPTDSTATPMASNRRHMSIDLTSSDSGKSPVSTQPPVPETKNIRHTLYIQMHLCSQKTLSDFLSNEDARKGNAVEHSVDIPLALSLFHQVAAGVKHVHEQGLIHRDLKPSNCFIDDGVVKVGDFGLSRESSEPSAGEQADDWVGGEGDDFSAGVGTRAYASPEQQKGSNYDSSTDVYSLGIMLFELCYPMCTGMERNIVFSRLRRREFPQDWQDTVAASFPIVHSLLTAMLSPRSQDRPTAETVASRVGALLGEYTVVYLDRKGRKEGSILIRVEAAAHEGVLPQTIQRIKDAVPSVEIEQYGLRGQDSKAIMEFALSSKDDDSLEQILSDLKSAPGVQVARQISDCVSVKL